MVGINLEETTEEKISLLIFEQFELEQLIGS